jgi:UDP-GlcNAc:undecaprenyl-phosphate GlcNAc-1-phosphate transferase
MITVLLIFSGALAFAIGGTPVARRLAWRMGVTDAPSERKVHEQPMPLLGGLAIYAAVMLALLVFGNRQEVSQLAGILIGATLMSFLGLWDDRRPMRPALRLVLQVGAAAVAVASGVRVQLTGEAIVDVTISLLWIVAITNAINFMDNMDGLAGGVSAIAAGYFLLLALANDQQLVAPLSAAVLGACLGFLYYNFNPASIFMGDGGSLFLGFILACIGIKLRFPGQPYTITWLVPVLVLAVPLFDLALVMVSRARRRVNPFTTAGKDHLSHRLSRLDLTHREAALVIYLVCCAAGGLAIFVSMADALEATLVFVGVAGFVGWALWRIEFADGAPRQA